ncbi:MAG: outer membrane lipoprotein carrier protein LolA [Bacteroidales bacterium]|nr:outer membrane lipoprotein carrier protein LolA [Bacteroidales bacterium]
MNRIYKMDCHPEFIEGWQIRFGKKNNHIYASHEKSSTKLNMTAIFFIIFSLFGLNNIHAQENGFTQVKDLTKAKTELSKLADNTSTIQSKFIQEKHLSFLTENIISKGEFYFKSPNQLRWEYSEPFEYIIVFNDKNILIKDEDKISTFDTESNKMFSEISNMMIGTIQGNIFTDSDRFAVKYFENNSQYLLELDPKLPEMKNMLKIIKIYIDKSDISVAKIKMIESSDDYTSIDFINRKLNQPIDNEIFNIK